MVLPDPPASPPATSGPPTLRPPGSARGPDDDSGHRLIWIGLAVLVILGLAVVVVLPRIVNRPDEPGRMADETPADVLHDREDAMRVPEEAEGSADRAAARADAEQTLADYLKLRARLELASAAVWGEPEWTQAAARVIEGDSLFGYQRFKLAAKEIRARKDDPDGAGGESRRSTGGGPVRRRDGARRESIAGSDRGIRARPRDRSRGPGRERRPGPCSGS